MNGWTAQINRTINMGSGRIYCCYLLWVCLLFSLAVYIFTSGFLLQRQVLSNETLCKDRGCNQPPTVFKKAIIIIIDALKYEFCVFNSSLPKPGTTKYNSAPLYARNNLPIINQLINKPHPRTGQIHGKLFRFMADPPTTTMQRLKGLTTGSLPTFIDVSANFASYRIQEDSLISQLVNNNRTIHFSGDDTWLSLYPDSFKKSDPQPSFDVWDLDTVDSNVKRFLYSELKGDWDVLIGHFLGVDHAGHKFGPNHPEMSRKLQEMNSVIQTVVKNLPKDTVLFVLGDHGMTSSGDHGGDSLPELEAALFVYGLKLSFDGRRNGGAIATVSQIDLVPTLALLLGVPIPFSNLGMLIDDIFIPTMLIKSEMEGAHTRLSSYSEEDLVKFRMSYMKSNVHQVHRYLTAYLAAGGQFPEKMNSALRKLASEVINRPGALSPRESSELYNKCAEFLRAARQMCQAVWVNFNDQAITVGLTLMVLHLSILALVVCKPQTRLLSTLISGFTLICIGASILMGSLFGASVQLIADLVGNLGDSLPSMECLILYSASFLALLSNGMCLFWKLRYCIQDMWRELVGAWDLQYGMGVLLFTLISISVFSNSFVVKESRLLCFCLVSLLLFYCTLDARRSSFISGLVLLSVGLTRLSCIYIRCREEDGPLCPLTLFHKPLSTLDLESGFYRNWRYFFTLLSLFILCLVLHLGLSSAGNLNGISCSVLTAKYLPWIICLLMASYWALQSFPSPLVSKLLPWQHNLLVYFIFLGALVGLLVLVVSPRLVYLQTRKRGPSRLITRQDNIPCYFNYMKANWRSSLLERCVPNVPLGYGLGSCLSAPLISIFSFFLLISMLLAGDGQCPAVLLQFLLMLSVLVIAAHTRLKQSQSVLGLLHVPVPSLVLWTVLDYLSFFTTGHQATFPHIQWSAAFIGIEGSSLAGESYSGHIVPALLVGWNTFSGSLLSALFLPLLLLAPFPLYLLLPAIRQPHPQCNGAGPLLESAVDTELERGESVLLDKVEDTLAALFTLYNRYILLKGTRLFCTMLAAAVLRRHLMAWKIFAPKFIFEGVGFFVSLAGVLLGYLIFCRVLKVVAASYQKLKNS